MPIGRIATISLASTALLVGSAALKPLLLTTHRESAAVAPAPTALVPPVDIHVVARGRVEPRSEAIDLTMPAIGTIKTITVDEGDTVHKGELLATLDEPDQQARVSEARATVALRQAELGKLQHGARPQEREQTAAELQQTQSSLVLAQREVARSAPLAARGVASQETLDQAKSTLGMAEAQTAAAAAAVALINAPPRSEDVAIAEARLALAKARLDEQQAVLDKAELRAPIDGVVLRRFMRPGEVISVQPPTPILEIGDISRLRVRAQIDESDVAHIAVGEHCWVTAQAYGDRRFGGVITQVAPELGRKTITSDDPSSKLDTKVLEVLITLDRDVHLPVGLRVDATVELPSTAAQSPDLQSPGTSGALEPRDGDRSPSIDDAAEHAALPARPVLAVLSQRLAATGGSALLQLFEKFFGVGLAVE